MADLSFSIYHWHEEPLIKICAVYMDYVAKKYGEAIVVFDGYRVSPTKDMTHQRWARGQAGVAVTFTDDMKLTMSKEKFY